MAGTPEQGIWKGIKKGDVKISWEALPKAPSSRLKLVNQSAAKMSEETTNQKQAPKRSLSEELKDTLEKDKKKVREITDTKGKENDSEQKDELMDLQTEKSIKDKDCRNSNIKKKPRIISEINIQKEVRRDIILIDKSNNGNEIDKNKTKESMEMDDMMESESIMTAIDAVKNIKEDKLKTRVYNIKDTNSKEKKINKFEVIIKDNGKINKFTKRTNMLKILHFLRHEVSGIHKLRMLMPRKAATKSDINAEDTIKEINKKGKEQIMAFIPNRLKERWGVIAEWPFSMEELLEVVDPHLGNYTLEKMKKRIIDKGETTWIESKAIMIKYKGENLPTKLWAYDGKFGLKITPYMTSIKQCTRCFRYGQRRPACRSEFPACFVCGEPFHGLCTKKPNCINCNEAHNATDSNCVQKNLEVLANRLVAYRNISYIEARRMAMEELGIRRISPRENKSYRKEHDSDEEDTNRLPSYLDGDLFPELEKYK